MKSEIVILMLTYIVQRINKTHQCAVKEMNKAAEVLEEVEEAQDKSKASASTGATVPDSSDSHFFYANSPVMEFNLANGKSGSVGQTPRK